jgi:hypothetical protein
MAYKLWKRYILIKIVKTLCKGFAGHTLLEYNWVMDEV